MKRLALFLDGTWNDPASDTNVSRLCRLVAPTGADGVEQVKPFYGAGVGTKWYDRIRGGAVGMGLSANVREAYEWLLQKYADGDEVYVFGFSRGAYTARSLGGLIAGCGLARAGAPFDVTYLYERYQRRRGAAVSIYQLQYIRDVSKERALTAEENTLLDHSRRIPIRMIGVWDTVGALGVPWTGMPLVGRDQFYFHNPNLSKIYQNAFQALAVDEHRGAYKPTLWTIFAKEILDGTTPPPPSMPARANVEQRWFIGAHANVGGGYPDDALGRLPLAWLQSKAQALGLRFTESVKLAGNEHLTKPADSYGRFMFHTYRLFTLGRRHYRPIGVSVNRVKKGWSYPVNEVIDASVFRRCADVSGYRPPNLLEWCKRTGRLPGNVLGDQPAH